MRTFKEIRTYYEEMLATWTDPAHDVDIEKVNRALANWHAVGVYLTQQTRDHEANLFAQEQTLKQQEDIWYQGAVRALKEGMPNSHTPTARAIEAEMSVKKGQELSSLRRLVKDAQDDVHALGHLRRTHDKYVQVLSTLSSNMRTDFMYAGAGDNPQIGNNSGANRPFQISQGTSRASGAVVDSDLDFMKEITGMPMEANSD